MTFLTNKLTNGSKLSIRQMSNSGSSISLDSFSTFGDLLKYLRRRARLTQRELSIAVKYSEAQISRLEQNQRPPDLVALTALFIPALDLEEEPEIVTRLMELAALARGEPLHPKGTITVSRSVPQEVLEDVRMVEENILHNLPLPLTSFVGRSHEIAELRNLLGTAKLITLTGSGGCGKTRLALETAGQLLESYRDGIWFIELASISDPGLVPSAVTSTLGLPEARDGNFSGALTKHLLRKQMLLILDNCEQVVSGVARLAEELLQMCPRLQILATSREVLTISGEVQFRVPSLSMRVEKPSNDDSTSTSEAVQLFVERAQSILPSFVLDDDVLPSVTRICQIVDGMPLGIELAAARATVLSIHQIAARLEESFQLLSGGRTTMPRHQTLQATIEWSYNLLPEMERVILQRVSVFSGGWALEAAESIVSDGALVPSEQVLELLSQLINKSLVVVEWHARSEAHYTMLQTIHEFAWKKLSETDEAERIRSRHFDYFLSLAQKAQLFGSEKGRWLNRLEAEHENLRSALVWSLQVGDVDKGAELILSILDYYWFRGYSTEAREWMEKFLAIESPPSPRRALLLQKAGWLTRASGDFQKADALLHRALEMAIEIDDKNRASWALMDLSLSAREQGNMEGAISFNAQALTFAQETAEDRAIGVCLYNLAENFELTGDLDRSRMFWEQGLHILRAEGDPTHIAWGVEGLAGNAFLAKDFAGALKFHLESLTIKVDVMDKLGIAYSFEGLAQISAAEKEYERAAVLWGAADHLRELLGIPLESSRRDMYTSLIPNARAQLGDEGFNAAWKKGRAMTLNEAIEFALALPRG